MTTALSALENIGLQLAAHGRELQAVAEQMASAADTIARDMMALVRAAGEGGGRDPSALVTLGRHTTAAAEEITGLADWLRTFAGTLSALADNLASPGGPGLAATTDAASSSPVPGCQATPQEVTPCGNRT